MATRKSQHTLETTQPTGRVDVNDIHRRRGKCLDSPTGCVMGLSEGVRRRVTERVSEAWEAKAQGRSPHASR